MTQSYLGNVESETLDHIARAKARLRDDDTSISWGLPHFDAKIGKPRPGQLAIIGAIPGNGKTTFALNFMMRLHDGHITPNENSRYKTCYLGTEMVPDELMLLWTAIYLNYDPDAVLSNQWHVLPDGARNNVELQLECLTYEVDRTLMPVCQSPSVSELLRHVDEAVHWGANVLVFDHLHRIKPEIGQEERNMLGLACKALKDAAVQHNILILAMSQLRREEHGVFERYRPPHLTSFAGSSEIEGNADIGIGLYRPLKPMNTKQERAVRNGDIPFENFIRPNTMAAKLLKHRYRGSQTDTVVLLTTAGGRIDDWAEDWDQINREDQHLRTQSNRSLRDLQEEDEILAASEGVDTHQQDGTEGTAGSEGEERGMSELSFDL